MPLTYEQYTAVDLTERITSAVSIVGNLFIILTFFFSSSFDKPINRLIFFASWGNIGSSISCMISDLGPASLMERSKFNASGICQVQAFLVQMFRGVDCYWAFFMAINVYLVFFRGYTTHQLRKLDIWYLLACYGLSFIPAFVFLFVSTKERGHVYGSAIVWCWISEEWDWMRLVFLYGIVWITILFAFIVYFMAAKVIWSKREHLNGFLNPLNETPFANTITTEIEIIYEERSIVKDASDQGISENVLPCDQYVVDIQATPQQQYQQQDTQVYQMRRMRSLTREVAQSETNPEAWLYARVAILFFIAMIITWVPASVNRIWQMADPSAINFSLNYIESLMLSLQGVWNVIVYVITSQTACQRLAYQLFPRSSRKKTRLPSGSPERYPSGGKQRLESVASK
ncbi:5b588a3d-5b50-4c68-802b-8cd30523de75 [Sclerotinia trifoliorum]|uniref:5b588a3d-5b50-4c68-802b-8cd30523de75 n=1 Tax=Sclerotinia trifoliorum TaxID=28548 RepID=A0A8H2ZSD0_9HELO|nr:5b588a3d-5b50-4c68-802b-8cd30523de75 [Sclerotinia trifoliorum]